MVKRDDDFVPPKMPKARLMTAMTLGVVALVISLIALVMVGWYTIDVDDEGGLLSYKSSYGLSKVKTEIAGATVEEDYGELEKEATSQGDKLESIDKAKGTKYLLLFGFVLIIIFIILTIMATRGLLEWGVTWAPVVMGIIAGVMLFIAAVYFAGQFPVGLENDTGIDTDKYGGLGAAWYLVLVSGALAIVGASISKAPPLVRSAFYQG